MKTPKHPFQVFQDKSSFRKFPKMSGNLEESGKPKHYKSVLRPARTHQYAAVRGDVYFRSCEPGTLGLFDQAMQFCLGHKGVDFVSSSTQQSLKDCLRGRYHLRMNVRSFLLVVSTTSSPVGSVVPVPGPRTSFWPVTCRQSALLSRQTASLECKTNVRFPRGSSKLLFCASSPKATVSTADGNGAKENFPDSFCNYITL